MFKQIDAKFFDFQTNRNLQYLFLFIITLIAATLRFYKLGEWSFTGDEVITVKAVQNTFDGSILPHQVSSRGLSTMLIGPVVALLGINEWSARLVPALIGTISIPILYFPIRKMFYSTAALVAVLLLAISPWHIYWSQSARYLSSLMLFYTLALLTFYFSLEERNPRYLVLSLIFLALAAWERLFALHLVPVVLSYVMLLKILPIQEPLGLRYRIFWWIIPASMILIGFFFSWRFINRPEVWINAFIEIQRTLVSNPVFITKQFVRFLSKPIVLMATFSALYLLSKKHRASLLLGLGAILPLLVIITFSFFQAAYVRYAFPSLMCWFVLVGLAVSELISKVPKNVRILAFGVLIVLQIEPLYGVEAYYKYHGLRADWRSAYELISREKRTGDIFVAQHLTTGEYYLGEEKLIHVHNVEPDSALNNGNRVWFAVYNGTAENPKYKWIKESSQLMYQPYELRVYLHTPTKISENDSEIRQRTLHAVLR